MNPQVLVVSRDQMLLHTRRLILGAFFEVQGAGRIREAEALISTHTFDLIVLCYTLSASECRQVLDLVADQKPQPKVLILNPAGSPAEDALLNHAVVLTEAGPYLLLKKTGELLGVDIKSKSSLAAA
jgi:DNA-binding response OmpR family regulator